MFNGGLNAFKKHSDKYSEGYERIFGKDKYDDVEGSKDYDPFAMYKPKQVIEADRKDAGRIEVRMAELSPEEEREAFAHDIVQPIKDGNPNPDFYQHYGQKAMDSALKDLGYK